MERIESWSIVLRSMERERAITLLASALYGARPTEIAHGLNQEWSSADIGISAALWHAGRRLSDTGLAGSWFPEDGDAIVIDEGLRALIREWKIEERFAPRCQQCDAPFARRVKGGRRPQQYCSNACKQKAYRRRKAGESPSELVCHTPREVDRALRAGLDVVRCEICNPRAPIDWGRYLGTRMHEN
ncbi:hypothetical protein [Streptomyces sp. NPDC039028]|uniref:hypothetical protein n=1 Tax=unclassified Streptomyces TaxID=2593676 RepID=UPI0033D1AB51